MNDVIKTIKEIHDEDDGKNEKECGFPEDSLNKVIVKLET